MKKILLVDDSEPDHFLAKVTVETFDPDIKLLQAYNGREALSILDTMNPQPDVILLDVNMPLMDGHEFLEEYNKRNDRTNVLMLTSSILHKDKARASAYDFVKGVISKPIDEEFLKKIPKMIS